MVSSRSGVIESRFKTVLVVRGGGGRTDARERFSMLLLKQVRRAYKVMAFGFFTSERRLPAVSTWTTLTTMQHTGKIEWVYLFWIKQAVFVCFLNSKYLKQRMMSPSLNKMLLVWRKRSSFTSYESSVAEEEKE